jgi:Tfp pilus assembly protein PilO
VIVKLRERILNELSDLTEKSEKKEDLAGMFRDKSREIALTEEAIKDEISEVKERLEILQLIKK